jgi:hypothetical protein
MQGKIKKAFLTSSDWAEGFISSPTTFWLLFIIFATINFSTLGLHPLPWFDEVFFADISNAYKEAGKFNLQMSPNIFRSEILFYGPVYFFIQSLIIKYFGLDIVQFRMLNFLAGILLALVFRVIILNLTKNKGISNLLSLLLLIDPIFGQNIHSGRMDMVATLPAIVGIWAYFRFSTTKNPFFLYFLAILFSIGYLTTPRVLFIIIPMFLVFLPEIRRINPFHLVACILIFLIPVFGWIMIKTGGIGNYLKMFDNGNVAHHIGPKSGFFSFFRYGYYLPIYCLVLYFGFLTVYDSVKCQIVHSKSLMFLLVIIMFHILVVEKGPYSAMVLPFYFGLIGVGMSQIQNQAWTKTLALAGIELIFIFYLGLFIAKNGFLIFTKDERNQNVVEKQVDLSKLKGKKVVASFEYYYLVKNAGAEYNSYETAIEMTSRLRFHIDTLKMDYLFLNHKDLISHQVIQYLGYGKFEKIDELAIESKVSNNRFLKSLSEKGNFYFPTFSGILYKRLEKELVLFKTRKKNYPGDNPHFHGKKALW